MILDIHIHTHLQDPMPVIRACQRHLPDHQVTLLVDGDGRKYDWPNTIYFHDRLKPQPNGGAWLKRWFTFALDQGCEAVLKIDPDSKVHRPFQEPPPDADLFGCIMETRPGRIVHGGSQGISRTFMRRALPLLDDERYRTKDFSMRDKTASCDKIVADLAHRLNVPLTPWGEVTYFPFPWSGTRYAISHGRWHKE